MAETVELPPHTVPVHCESFVEGVWLAEETVHQHKHQHVSVAHATVQPTSLTVPVCILNVLDEAVTVYAAFIIQCNLSSYQL